MKNDEPLISVIVPVCNGQDYLENCIRSVEKQTYENLEVIIVNNGSTDKTAAVCGKLRADYANVTVLTLNDRDVSAARNAGIDAAGGELITFVDADDRLCPAMLRTLYKCMTENGSDVAGCSFFIWSSEEEWRREALSGEAVFGGTTYHADRYLEEAVLCGNSRCWSKLYRRAIFDKVRFQVKLAVGEDMLFLIRMLPHVDKIVETDYRGYGYFQNPAGVMNREFTPRYMDQITCWQLAREDILRMNPGLDAQVTALYMMGIMLTAGKIAILPASVRRKQRENIRICHERLKDTMHVSGAFKRLSAGYRIKTIFFRLFPNLYLYLYHWAKSMH